MSKRTCRICGSSYKYCPTCKEYASKPKYMIMLCSENCKAIWDVLCRYGAKRYTKEEASAELDKLDLSNIDSFNENIKTIISEIRAEDAAVEDDASTATEVSADVIDESMPSSESVDSDTSNEETGTSNVGTEAEPADTTNESELSPETTDPETTTEEAETAAADAETVSSADAEISDTPDTESLASEEMATDAAAKE